MSEADMMFEAEGYKKVNEDNREVLYRYHEVLRGETFDFYIKFAKVGKLVWSKNHKNEFVGIGANVLKAIVEKTKELGWYD